MASSPQTPTTTTAKLESSAGDVSDEEYKPTDLSMPPSSWQDGPQDLSTASASSSMQLQLNMSTSMTAPVSSGMTNTAVKLEQAS